VFALGGEEVCPGDHLGVLLEQGAALAFGHTAPDAEFDTVIEGVSAALENDRAMPADNGCFALGGAAYEELIWICLAASSLGDPGDSRLGFRAMDNGVRCRIRICPARGGPRS
jgi:hypothetical protein